MKEEPKPVTLPIYFLPKFIFLLVVLAAIFILSSCSPQPDYDIRGSWDYVMTAGNGDIYDLGYFTFDGKPAKGVILQTNIYEVDYDGEFKVSSTDITLRRYKRWKGIYTNANTISGIWHHNDGDEGSFKATIK